MRFYVLFLKVCKEYICWFEKIGISNFVFKKVKKDFCVLNGFIKYVV